jgi:hypothetical protein
VLGTVPFLLFAISFLVTGIDRQGIAIPSLIKGFFGLLNAVLFFGGLAYGWYRSFPRWSYPYIGLILTISLYLFIMRGGVFEFFLWVFMVAMVVLAAVLMDAAGPFVQFAKSVWRDWSLLSFAVFGFLPLWMVGMFDDVNLDYKIPYFLLFSCFMIAGAAGYMVCETKIIRFGILLFATLAVIGGTAYGNALYWDGRLEHWMNAPADGTQTAWRILAHGAKYGALLWVPVLIGISHWLVGKYHRNVQ